MSLESGGGMILTEENRRTRRKICSSATLSTTNHTWIDPGANPALRGERPRHLSFTLNSNWSSLENLRGRNCLSSLAVKVRRTETDETYGGWMFHYCLPRGMTTLEFLILFVLSRKIMTNHYTCIKYEKDGHFR
jgi:hypothetical protein